MAGQNGVLSPIEAHDRAYWQITKLQFIRACLADGNNPTDYEGAVDGMFRILDEAIEELKESVGALYQSAVKEEAEGAGE